MIEDILYKTLFILMLIAFPLFYIITGIVNIIRYIKLKKDRMSIHSVHKSVNAVNTALLAWCLICMIIYTSINYITGGNFFYDIEVDVWFYFPLLVTILLLLFRRIRKYVFAWLFFTSCIITGWIFFITFFQLSLS